MQAFLFLLVQDRRDLRMVHKLSAGEIVNENEQVSVTKGHENKTKPGITRHSQQ